MRDTFKTPKFGTIAGCMVLDGRITRAGDTQARLLRDNVVIHEGKIGSLRRFKDDVSEVKAGFECGIGFDRYNDIKVGDVIEAFVVERVATPVWSGKEDPSNLLACLFVMPQAPEPLVSATKSRRSSLAADARGSRSRHRIPDITRVKVSPDLQQARVYYTTIGDDKARRESARALERATPFLRRQVGQRLRLKRVPS